MRVLVVAPYVGEIYGGPGRVVVQLAQALATNAQVQVDLVTTNANGEKSLEVTFETWMEQAGYRIQYFPGWNRQDLIWSPRLLSWLSQHVRDYDLVHTHCLFMPIITATHWICRLQKVPFVMTPHGMLEPWALAHKAWKKKLYYAAIEKPMLRRAKAIHVLTPVEAQQVESLGLHPAVVVPNGIYRREFEQLPEPTLFYQAFPETQGKTLILFLGRLDPKKGLDLLAEAFETVQSQFPHTHLVIAGPDNIGYLPTAQGFFIDRGLGDRVTFTGMLTGDLKLAALAASSIYVCPSYSEGFSMSVLEGMAAGLSCVITEGCNFSEASHVAQVVKPNGEAIAQALLNSLKTLPQAQDLGAQAREFVFQNYTWDRSVRKLLEAYR